MNALPSKPIARRIGRAVAMLVALIVVLVLLAWLATKVFRGGGDPGATLAGPYDKALVERGAYLAAVGDCAACHTAPGGRAFAGGLAIRSPLGTIYSSNITPDRQTGIGAYTYGEFERAVRRGIDRGGRTFYPAMPYPSYAHVSDADIKALYAYFMQGVAPVRQANRPTDIPWPLSLRWPLAWWRWMFAPAVPPSVDAPPSTPLARGAYLVEGLGHCGACHTPRAFTLQEKALTASDGPAYLGGAAVDHWFAPSLRNGQPDGLGSLDAAELVALLKTGHTAHGAIFGGMGEVVHHSTQHMSDRDLADVAAFLKSLPSDRAGAAPVYDPAAARAMYAGDVSRPGARLYVDNCATCHRTSGHGYPASFPALALNPVVNSDDPTSLIHIVLAGGSTPGTGQAPTQFAMPSFADRLSDQEIATVLSFVRSSWGNHAPPVTASEVRKLRDALPPSKPVATDYDPRH